MNVIVISPHPDDETLGAGGTILRMVAEGHYLTWLNITNMKEEYGYSKEMVEKRQEEIAFVRKALGFERFFDLGIKPTEVDSYPRNLLIQRIKEIFEEVKPEVVILPYFGDAHSDHKVVFEATFACTKSFRAPYVKKILCMEIPSETNYGLPEHTFYPNYYVSIDEYIDKKIEIFSNYESEIQYSPYPRSADAIKGLAAYRGSSCSKRYAEAYQLLKEIY